MQILARSHEHKIRTVTAGRGDLSWVRRPTNLLQLKEGRREQGEREKDGRNEKEGESEREGTAKKKEGESARINTPWNWLAKSIASYRRTELGFDHCLYCEVYIEETGVCERKSKNQFHVVIYVRSWQHLQYNISFQLGMPNPLLKSARRIFSNKSLK